MPRTIVLIDDDTDDLDAMKEAIDQVDSTLLCISFSHAEEALRLLGKELVVLPDFIFIDVNMPKISGKECLTTLRRTAELTNTPIIMHSTSLPIDMAKSYLAIGASYTFQKPYAFNDYLRILEEIFYKTVPYPHHIL